MPEFKRNNRRIKAVDCRTGGNALALDPFVWLELANYCGIVKNSLDEGEVPVFTFPGDREAVLIGVPDKLRNAPACCIKLVDGTNRFGSCFVDLIAVVLDF